MLDFPIDFNNPLPIYETANGVFFGVIYPADLTNILGESLCLLLSKSSVGFLNVFNAIKYAKTIDKIIGINNVERKNDIESACEEKSA